MRPFAQPYNRRAPNDLLQGRQIIQRGAWISGLERDSVLFDPRLDRWQVGWGSGRRWWGGRSCCGGGCSWHGRLRLLTTSRQVCADADQYQQIDTDMAQ